MARWIFGLLIVLSCAVPSFSAQESPVQIKSLQPGAIVAINSVINDGKVMISVADADEKPILCLGIDDFTVTQNGKTAKIISVESLGENLDVPRQIVLVLDNSFSMLERDAVKPILAALDELLKIVRPVDQVSLVVFDDHNTLKMGGRDLHVRILQSNNPAALKAFITQAYSRDEITSKTVLHEGMLAGLDLVNRMPAEDPKFMVVFSDGVDLNSDFTKEEVVKATAEVSGFAGYAVDYMPGPGVDPLLENFITRSSGQAWKATAQTTLVPIFQAVATKMQYHYVVSYLFPTQGSLTVMPERVTVREVKIIDASPTLAHVYFPPESNTIPVSYLRLKGQEETSTFNEASLRGTLEKYHQLLNIIGKRLQEHPEATITLLGCNANFGKEKGNIELSTQRAQAVKGYIQTTWGIAGERIKVAARNLPAMPSTSRLTEGRSDNQRVEISSDDPAILDLITSTYIDTRIDTSVLTLQPVVESVYGIASWHIKATGGGTTLADMSGEGALAPAPEVPLQINNLNDLAKFGAIEVSIDLEDLQGQQATLTAEAVKVDFIQTREQLAQKQGYQIQEKYALVLFAFDSNALDARNQQIVDQIVARIRVLPQATVEIVGHTDNIGKKKYNLKLSEKRAKAVYDLLMSAYGEEASERIHYRGAGPNDPPYDNLSPESRAFNRTVTITLDYTATK